MQREFEEQEARTSKQSNIFRVVLKVSGVAACLHISIDHTHKDGFNLISGLNTTS